MELIPEHGRSERNYWRDLWRFRQSRAHDDSLTSQPPRPDSDRQAAGAQNAKT